MSSNDAPAGKLPRSVFRYVLRTSGLHQLFLLLLTVNVFLLEVVPLELQRRIVNDLVKRRLSWVMSLCTRYTDTVLNQRGLSSRSTSIAAGRRAGQARPAAVRSHCRREPCGSLACRPKRKGSRFR